MLRRTLTFAAAIAGSLFLVQAAHALTFKTLYQFKNQGDGYGPETGVVIGPDGALYGTTVNPNAGVAFRLDPSSGGLTTIYNFQVPVDDSLTSVVFGSDGALYGTHDAGGAFLRGAIFKLSPPTPGGTTWTETILYSFSATEPSPPNKLIFGPGGLLFGTTSQLAGPSYTGTVFQFDKDASTLKTLHSFSGSSGGDAPVGSVAFDGNGVLYGMTYRVSSYNGKAYSINLTSNQFTTLHAFGGKDNLFPAAGPSLASDGTLYGTSQSGASRYVSTVFSIAPASKTLTRLHEFPKGNNGWGVSDGVIVGQDGQLYGTTNFGGNCSVSGDGCGTIFKLDPATRKFTNLHKFTGTDGAYPFGGLTEGPNGVFYGTTVEGGGSCNCGTVFEIIP